jgi:putative PIN family toxin of toxin-antitoxin system
MRVVVDTNVIVSACLTPLGLPAKIVDLAFREEFQLFVSANILNEYREVLSRPKFGHLKERTMLLVNGIEEVAALVFPVETVSQAQDEDDNRFLECALSCQADFLVTGNTRHFPESFHNTLTVSPREFLARLALKRDAPT